MGLHLIVVLIITIFLYFLRYALTKNRDYWKQRDVPHLKPIPLFGNHKDTILLRKHVTQTTEEICQMFPKEPYIGTLFGTKPALIVRDPDLIKLVLSKDFYYFSGRDVSDYALREPITSNVFFSGGDRWKIQRQNLTPLFTSAKMKSMFYLIKNCANQLECLLEEETKSLPHIEGKLLFAKYTIDCIVSCVFGFEADTLKKSDTPKPFMIIGKKIFDTSYFRGLKIHWRVIWPGLFYGLRLSIFEKKVSSFFQNLIVDVITNRHGSKPYRNDFLDLLMTWKHKSRISGFSLSNKQCDDKKIVSLQVNNNLLVAQCVALFGAGFETTATSLTFLLFELAKSQETQSKVLQEIDSYIDKCNGAIEFECINELPYLESCIEESLRLYPVLGVITREVMDDYCLPTGVRLQKGDNIHIPVKHIHYNADYFPEPAQFRPERFFGDERKNIKPFTFLPFGEGPRICIGSRFSKMMMYAGLLTIFKKYRVELAENMPRSVKMKTASLAISPASEINLKFISRNNNVILPTRS